MADTDKNGIKTFYAKDRTAWRKWLQKNHKREKSVWLVLYYKKSSTPSIYYNEAVEEALCFGWIDSKGNKRDHESSYLYFAQRNPLSKWSKLNKQRVKNLMKAGLMTEAGLTMIRLAKQTKTWTALNKIERLTIPADLKKAFAKNKRAEKNFSQFPPSTRKRILDWINSGKLEKTRAKRIKETVSLAAANIRANEWVKKS
jgi:uncharacterized protein YdeI (YjbR/CyaY-like superfamily)